MDCCNGACNGCIVLMRAPRQNRSKFKIKSLVVLPKLFTKSWCELKWLSISIMQSRAVTLGLRMPCWKQTTFMEVFSQTNSLSATWLQHYKTVLSIKRPLKADFLFACDRKSQVNVHRSLWPFYEEGKMRSSFHYCLTSKPWQHKLIFNSVEAFVPGNHADCLLKTVVNSILQ